MSARTYGSAVLMVFVVVGCKPSPDEIKLLANNQRLERSTTLVEGDLIALDTHPADGDDNDMDLCVTARSTAPDVVRVERVKDKCRFFVLSGTSAGRATVMFEARNGSSKLVVDVTPR